MNHDEVLAAMRLWLEKAVIGLNLCPFAKSVYINEQVRFVVSDARHLDAFLEQLDDELALLASTDPQKIDTTLLIHPTLFPDFLDFNDIVGVAEASIDELDLQGVIQIASFHPHFQFDGSDPDDITNYTNRAPYATLHLLREDSLALAIERYPDVEGIYQRNIETMKKLGHEGWKALGLAPRVEDDR